MELSLQEVLDDVKSTADFGYVDFSDINATNALGDNALHCVCVWGDLEAARILISAGIDINKAGEDNFTPLHVACGHGHPEIVKLLLAHGADTRARTLGDLPFTTARLAGRSDICAILHAHKDTQPDSGQSAHGKHLAKLGDSIEELEARIRKHCGGST